MKIRGELSKSGRSICRLCNKTIPKFIPRINYEGYFGRYFGSKYSCYACADEFFERQISELKKELVEMEKAKKVWARFLKQHSRKLVLDKLKDD